MADNINKLVSMQRDNIQKQLQQRYTNGKGSYTIELKWDDGRPTYKAALRDGEIDQFSEKFNACFEMSPDSIIIRQYKGVGDNAMEQPDAAQELRISPMKETRNNIIPGLGNVEQQYASQNFELDKRRMEFTFEQEKREIEYNHRLQIRDKDDEIKSLNSELAKTKELAKDQEEAIKELETQVEDLERKGGINATALLTAGLNGIGELARKNPDGKFLGLIPNRTLDTYLNKQSVSSSETSDTVNDSGTNTQINNITNFAASLSETDLNALYEIMVHLSNGDISANIQHTLMLLNSKS